MLITILLIFLITICILLNISPQKKRFPGPKHIISLPNYLFDLILNFSNKNLVKILLKIFYPESSRYIELTVPLASQYYTLKYGDIVQINLFNQPTIIISNCDFADYILRRNGKNYTLRFGNKLGLEYLGMENKGIIWNRNIQRWKYQRSNFFQKSLNSKILDDAKYVSNDATDYILKSLQTFEIETNIIDTMDLLRSITFTITCHLFLDLPIGSISIDQTKYYVNSIVQYFKAWEYFLLKPNQFYDQNLTNKHQKSVQLLNQIVEELVLKRETNQNCLFINSLLNSLNNQQITKQEMNQCILEMLIAGTDTSSVTMFYFLLALSDRKQLEDDLLKELKQNSYTILTNGLKESMRFKPVGPVIMRCAIQDDTYQNILIKKDTNIIINLVDMHRNNEHFLFPQEFNLINVQDKDLSNNNSDKNLFLPFGIGPKECVGRWLAKVEMEVIIQKLILNYSFKRANGTQTLEELQTRWDIAQQPTHPGYMRIQKREIIKTI
jgi:aromatase